MPDTPTQHNPTADHAAPEPGGACTCRAHTSPTGTIEPAPQHVDTPPAANRPPFDSDAWWAKHGPKIGIAGFILAAVMLGLPVVTTIP